MARVHPGETPASFIMEGFLDFISSPTCELARFLRSIVTFKIIPMLNPDGVALGNYRCSLMGFDLNRHWRDTNPWAQPGLHAVKSFLVALEKTTPVDFCFDIHAHSLATGSFMYGKIRSKKNV
jgi:murein tripeptide amidase MpaA